jgi:protein SCO1/2
MITPTRSVGRPDIGGPFNLTDINGNPVSNVDFLGKYHIVYFGFTHCPDICPHELRKLTNVLKILESRGVQITPIFISVDPKRDTPQRLRDYAKDYHPKTVWLTGTFEQIEAAAKKFRVYFSKPEETSQDYVVDHSIFFYVMSKKGECLDVFGKIASEGETVERVMSVIHGDIRENVESASRNIKA